MNSSSIDDLHPVVATKARRFAAAVETIGLQLVIVSTLRDALAQTKLYALGRTEQGPRANTQRELGVCVTLNPPGLSLHEYGCAFDAFPALGGYLLTGMQPLEWRAWAALRKIADSPAVNLQWGGRTRADGCLRELWHFYYTAGLTAAQLRDGARLPDVTLGEPRRRSRRAPPPK